MGLISWAESLTKKLNMWDISALKLYCVLIGMVIGAYVAAFVKQYVITFIVVIVILMAYLVYKVFIK